ncbi:tetratricopeptide repeat protein [Petrimonas mucosa]|uniref:tetratricopeptide repeat protein n=1 Tax=Petrimonas mucosa TaxID=1642646 RepID=UPI003C773B4C
MKKILSILFSVSISVLSSFGQVSNIQSIINEGVALHDSAQYQKAIEKFKLALKINPNSTLALYEISLSYLELKDYENASKFSTQVINSNDKNLSVGAYAVKSEALAGMKQIDNAITLLQEGLIKNGESYLLHFNIALNYYKKGNTDKTLEHVSRAIELDKTNSGAFLLNAYALRDKGYWVRSIYSFQLFLLLEPDSKRSKNAFEEMLQTMLVNPATEIPVERSFIQQQLMRDTVSRAPQETPPLSPVDGLNRDAIYNAIKRSMDSLKAAKKETDTYLLFTEVNRSILNALQKEKEQGALRSSSFWTFDFPFFKSILDSNHYDTYCRYISVSYFPESLQWWENNKADAKSFIHWFENGEDNSND